MKCLVYLDLQVTAWLLGLLIAGGCARDSYQFGLGPSIGKPRHLGEPLMANPLSQGGSHPRLDRLEKAVARPGEIVRLALRKPEPAPSEIESERSQAVHLAQEYLQANELEDIYIDVRRYEPAQQWARIQENQRIAPFWKATGGTLSFVRYSLLPGRVLRSDHYDPYSNTLSLNSAKPTRGIHEAASAKQYRQQPRLGTYAALQYLPLVPLVHQLGATSDVLTYARVTEQTQLEQELYPTTYSRLGSAAVSETLSLTPLAAGTPLYTGPLMRVTGGVAGTMAGKGMANRARKTIEAETNENGSMAWDATTPAGSNTESRQAIDSNQE